MQDFISSKPQIKQKNTWIGLGTIGFGVYQLISGDTLSGWTAISAGVGLIFSHGS